MPETKINVSSPFIKKVIGSDLDSAQISVWIYGGDKSQTLGEPDYVLYRDVAAGSTEVTFDLDRIIKDYIELNITSPLNNNVDYVKWVRIEYLSLTDVPVVEDLNVYTTTQVPVTFQLSASDTQNRSLTYIVVTPPTNGSTTNTSSQFTYTSNASFVGTDTLVYKVNNGEKDSSNATVTITVTAPVIGVLVTGVIYDGTDKLNVADNVANNGSKPTEQLYFDGNDITGLSEYSLIDFGVYVLGKKAYINSSKTIKYPDGWYGSWFIQPHSSDQRVGTFRVSNGSIVELEIVTV
jgi:hypothetical protein